MSKNSPSVQSFLRDQGYIFDTGLSGHVAYAPFGKMFKNRIETFLRHYFDMNGFKEMEAPLISSTEIWKKSGHVDRFNELVVKLHNGNLQSLEKLLEEYGYEPAKYLNNLPACRDVVIQISARRDIPGSKVYLPSDVKMPWCFRRDMMMTTQSGHHEKNIAILRPETATSTYQFVPKLYALAPSSTHIKIYQIGKSFRNEISPRNSLLRSREFTQAEFQHIILDPELLSDPDKIRNIFIALRDVTLDIFKSFNIPASKLRLKQHSEEELIFYAQDAWDIEVNLQGHGWTEIAGIHHRGTHDLKSSQFKHEPIVLEVAIGIDRLLYAIVDTLMSWKNPTEGKNILNIPYKLSPIQVSVLPLLKNNHEIVEKAKEVKKILSRNFVVDYQETASIGKRYLRNGVRGIPYSITIDFDSLTNGDVTIRDRDTEEQIRVPISDLSTALAQRFLW